MKNLFEKIISKLNLLTSWQEFKVDKSKKEDVILFEQDLVKNLLDLHYDLKNKLYHHGHYTSFFVHDPKLRHIHKPTVRDRIMHHSIVRIIEPIFEKLYIYDSYSSRKNKGTHRAVLRLKQMSWQLSKNNTKIVWVLKCDIKKFFDSVDHQILIGQLKQKIYNNELTLLLSEIIESYPPFFDARIERERERGGGETVSCKRGIPLGNLTSQLFSNIYLNPLDQFVKRKLKETCYIRYADDFVILSCNKNHLISLIPHIKDFLERNLKLELHQRKTIIGKLSRGIDFLGYVVFPYHILLRAKTRKRMIKNIKKNIWLLKSGEITELKFKQNIQSYFGILKHCRGRMIYNKIIQILKENNISQKLYPLPNKK